jgi:hypothetical protein
MMVSYLVFVCLDSMRANINSFVSFYVLIYIVHYSHPISFFIRFLGRRIPWLSSDSTSRCNQDKNDDTSRIKSTTLLQCLELCKGYYSYGRRVSISGGLTATSMLHITFMGCAVSSQREISKSSWRKKLQKPTEKDCSWSFSWYETPKAINNRDYIMVCFNFFKTICSLCLYYLHHHTLAHS